MARKQSPAVDQQLRRWLPQLEDTATRQQAIQALTEVGEPAVVPLGEVMRNADLNTSQAAARALTQIGAPAVETLCELLCDDDWNVTQAAALSLVRIGEPAVEPLCRVLANPDPAVSHLAAMTLTRIRKPACDPLCRSLGHPQPEVRARARSALMKMGALAIPTVARAFHQPEKYAPPAGRGAPASSESAQDLVRTEAADVLCGIGGGALDVLCSALGSPEEPVRRIAAGALEQNKSRSVEALCRFLVAGASHPRPQSGESTPALAAALLGRLGRLRAQGALLQALDSPDARVRAAAARALGELAAATRSPELRTHLSQLRRRLRGKTRDSDEGLALEKAITSIEATTSNIASMPLPSVRLAPEKDTLPRAAGSSDPATEALPITSDAAADPAATGVSQSWWTRLTRRFR